MEPIIVTRKDGVTTYPLHDGQMYVTDAKLVRALLEDDYVDVSVEGSSAGDYRIGDYITVHGRRYTMNQLPEVEKTGSRSFSIKLRFEGALYDLARAAFLLNVNTTTLGIQDVRGDSFIGNLPSFMGVLVANANRVFPNKWALGSYPPDTDEDTQLTFGADDNCLSVLQTLCDTFDCEFEIAEANGVNTINLGTTGSTFPHSFRYGAHRGLYELVRKNSDSDNIITKMWVYGGTKNLPQLYPCDRLLLANKTKSTSYITASTQMSTYGVFEGVRIYDDVFPEREAEVTGIDNGDVLKFSDSTMFDLNAKWADTNADYQYYLELTGQSHSAEIYANYQANVASVESKYLINGGATVHFNSGGLAGYDFTVASYDHSTHTFTLQKITDDRGQEFPDGDSAAFQIGVGDKYTLTNILLPKIYIQTAQQRLMAAGRKELNEMRAPKVNYELKIDEEYIREKCPGVDEALKPGDTVTVSDTDFVASDTQIRVKKVEQNLLNFDEYTVTLEDVSILKRRRARVTDELIRERIDDSVFERIQEDGSDGKSAYQIWLDAGNSGTEADFLASLKGADGRDGTNGTNGINGKTFTPSITGDVLSWSNDGGLPNPTPIRLTQKAEVMSSDIVSLREVRIGKVDVDYEAATLLDAGNAWNCNLYNIYDDLVIYFGSGIPSGKRLEMAITNADSQSHQIALKNGRTGTRVLLAVDSGIKIEGGCTLILRARWCEPESYDSNLEDNTSRTPLVFVELINLIEIK